MAPGAPLTGCVRRAGAALVVCAVAALGCREEVLNLGSSELLTAGAGATGGGAPRVWAVQSQPVLPQEAGVLLANPTLTESMDELFYSSQQRGGAPDPNRSALERATLAPTGWGGGSEVQLGELAMPDVASPAVALSGRELWLGLLGSNAPSNTDVFVSLRQGDAWSTPKLVQELSSGGFDDAPRPPAVNGTIMPLSSKRHGAMPAHYQIYLATRSSDAADAPWSEPSQALLGRVNSAEFQSADGFLNANGLELYFSSTRDGDHADSDLYVARRTTLDESFGDPEPLVDLNDPEPGVRSEERMPWLSPGGDKLYFVSNRSGLYALYLATRL